MFHKINNLPIDLQNEIYSYIDYRPRIIEIINHGMIIRKFDTWTTREVVMKEWWVLSTKNKKVTAHRIHSWYASPEYKKRQRVDTRYGIGQVSMLYHDCFFA